jgi:hypothetical protein
VYIGPEEPLECSRILSGSVEDPFPAPEVADPPPFMPDLPEAQLTAGKIKIVTLNQSRYKYRSGVRNRVARWFIFKPKKQFG